MGRIVDCAIAAAVAAAATAAAAAVFRFALCARAKHTCVLVFFLCSYSDLIGCQRE